MVLYNHFRLKWFYDITTSSWFGFIKLLVCTGFGYL